ncbi:MAG: hypothetical protein JNK00_13210 [Flavipsychrobacter sp.]|nr:hypothetical protein [Flavipsychrobacter sp.]
MKQIKLVAANTFIILLWCLTSYAQGPGFDDDVVDDVPLDGGVSALVIAGAAYGAKKLKDLKKK